MCIVEDTVYNNSLIQSEVAFFSLHVQVFLFGYLETDLYCGWCYVVTLLSTQNMSNKTLLFSVIMQWAKVCGHLTVTPTCDFKTGKVHKERPQSAMKFKPGIFLLWSNSPDLCTIVLSQCGRGQGLCRTLKFFYTSLGKLCLYGPNYESPTLWHNTYGCVRWLDIHILLAIRHIFKVKVTFFSIRKFPDNCSCWSKFLTI